MVTTQCFILFNPTDSLVAEFYIDSDNSGIIHVLRVSEDPTVSPIRLRTFARTSQQALRNHWIGLTKAGFVQMPF